MAASDHNVMSRRVIVAQAVTSLIPGERDAIRRINDFEGNDAAWYARIGRHMGDVADALAYGNRPVEDELLHVAAAVLAWVDQIMEERAR